MQGSWQEYQKTLDQMSKEASAKEQQLVELKKLQRRTEQENSDQKETVEQLKQQIAALQAQK